MKTITEFKGFDLQDALKTLHELTTSGKTPEETQQTLGEQKKLEGDKLKFYLSALTIAKAKPERLKRIVVFTLAENERAPNGAQKVEEQYYLTEYFPEPPGAHPKRRGKPGGDRRGGKRGKGKRPGRRPE